MHLIEQHFPRSGASLNIGCGGGREALALARMGYEVTAVDMLPDYVELTAARARNAALTIETAVMDATSLGFGTKVFDAVVMVGQLIRARSRAAQPLACAARGAPCAARGIAGVAVDQRH
ncbi:MAG: class I SAM-dependent methyltransferase [Deltaproteobacteria bacterium]|nr:class I SAM-dependent methyltransferase [Deltaproteobacteria bacterium]